MARLQEFYRDTVTKKLMEQFTYKSTMEVPRISKITLNMGVGEAVADKKILDNAVGDMQKIAGQLVGHPSRAAGQPGERRQVGLRRLGQSIGRDRRPRIAEPVLEPAGDLADMVEFPGAKDRPMAGQNLLDQRRPRSRHRTRN